MPQISSDAEFLPRTIQELMFNVIIPFQTACPLNAWRRVEPRSIVCGCCTVPMLTESDRLKLSSGIAGSDTQVSRQSRPGGITVEVLFWWNLVAVVVAPQMFTDTTPN